MSTFNEICYIFCCPPFPSRIASKLAFLPPEASYTLINENARCNLQLTEDAGWQYPDTDKDRLESFFTTTKRGHRISCLFVKCSTTPKYTILYSHGNAVDLGHMSSFYLGLGSYVNCNIFSYDYSGYGASESTPSEKNMYSDMEAAWNVLRRKYKLKGENIILYGQSIGTVPTIDLASKYAVAGAVLHSPMTSGMRVLCPKTTKTWFFDAFVTIHKVEDMSCPTLVIHGKQDNIIDFSHAVTIFEKCQKAVEPLWVDGAGHNDLDCACPAYLERLHFFVNYELEMIAKANEERRAAKGQEQRKSSKTQEDRRHFRTQEAQYKGSTSSRTSYI